MGKLDDEIDVKEANQAIREATGTDPIVCFRDNSGEDLEEHRYQLDAKRSAGTVFSPVEGPPRYKILDRGKCGLPESTQRFIQEWAHNGCRPLAAYYAVGLAPKKTIRNPGETESDFRKRYNRQASKNAHALLNTRAGKKYQEYVIKEMQKKYAASPEHVVKRIANRAQANVKDYLRWDSEGNFTFYDLEQLPRDVTARLKKVTINKRSGNLSIELHDAQAADNSLAKIFKLMNTETEEEKKKKEAAKRPPGMVLQIAGKKKINTLPKDEQEDVITEEVKDETPFGEGYDDYDFEIVEEIDDDELEEEIE